jgi:hypothetical protein
MKTFEQFLTENVAMGHGEFRLVARMEDKYTVRFYIHALGHNSDTPDFFVDENVLTPIGEKEQA